MKYLISSINYDDVLSAYRDELNAFKTEKYNDFQGVVYLDTLEEFNCLLFNLKIFGFIVQYPREEDDEKNGINGEIIIYDGYYE